MNTIKLKHISQSHGMYELSISCPPIPMGTIELANTHLGRPAGDLRLEHESALAPIAEYEQEAFREQLRDEKRNPKAFVKQSHLAVIQDQDEAPGAEGHRARLTAQRKSKISE